MLNQKTIASLDTPGAINRISRRQAIGVSVGFSALSYKQPSAQDNQSKFDSLRPTFELAFEVQQKAISIEPSKDRFSITEYILLDFRNRIETIDIANKSGVFIDNDTALLYSSNVRNVIPKNFIDAYGELEQISQVSSIRLIASQNIPLVPDSQSIQPESIPIIDPRNPKNTSDLQIIGDIIFDTIGILFIDSSPIIAVIKSDPNIEENVNNLLMVVSSKKYEDAIPIIHQLIFALLGFLRSGAWQKIPGLAANKIFYRLALRCTPIVGPIYLGSSLLVAIKANYHRFSFT